MARKFQNMQNVWFRVSFSNILNIKWTTHIASEKGQAEFEAKFPTPKRGANGKRKKENERASERGRWRGKSQERRKKRGDFLEEKLLLLGPNGMENFVNALPSAWTTTTEWMMKSCGKIENCEITLTQSFELCILTPRNDYEAQRCSIFILILSCCRCIERYQCLWEMALVDYLTKNFHLKRAVNAIRPSAMNVLWFYNFLLYYIQYIAYNEFWEFRTRNPLLMIFSTFIHCSYTLISVSHKLHTV